MREYGDPPSGAQAAMASKRVLLRALVVAESAKTAGFGVPSLVPKWRARREDRPANRNLHIYWTSAAASPGDGTWVAAGAAYSSGEGPAHGSPEALTLLVLSRCGYWLLLFRPRR